MRLAELHDMRTESEHRRYVSYKLADELRQSSDDLTRMARLFVATGEERFAEYFEEILSIRMGKKPRPTEYDLVYWDLVDEDGKRPRPNGEAISLDDLMVAQGFTVEEFRKLTEARERSDGLVRMEAIAMNAIRGQFVDDTGGFSRAGDSDPELARKIMFGPEYLSAKAQSHDPDQRVPAASRSTDDGGSQRSPSARPSPDGDFAGHQLCSPEFEHLVGFLASSASAPSAGSRLGRD